MTLRKCLAADGGLCYDCSSECPSCGAKKFTINDECELCRYCEGQYPVKRDSEVSDFVVLNIDSPAVIYIKGVSDDYIL